MYYNHIDFKHSENDHEVRLFLIKCFEQICDHESIPSYGLVPSLSGNGTTQLVRTTSVYTCILTCI